MAGGQKGLESSSFSLKHRWEIQHVSDEQHGDLHARAGVFRHGKQASHYGVERFHQRFIRAPSAP